MSKLLCLWFEYLPTSTGTLEFRKAIHVFLFPLTLRFDFLIHPCRGLLLSTNSFFLKEKRSRKTITIHHDLIENYLDTNLKGTLRSDGSIYFVKSTSSSSG
jgi:hypothetical protein